MLSTENKIEVRVKVDGRAKKHTPDPVQDSYDYCKDRIEKCRAELADLEPKFEALKTVPGVTL